MWIEFKRDDSCKLTVEQEAFRLACAAQRIEWHLVYTAGEAIETVQRAALGDCTGDTTYAFAVGAQIKTRSVNASGL
jgi:hypothetical protein